jgi:hypothetical protein
MVLDAMECGERECERLEEHGGRGGLIEAPDVATRTPINDGGGLAAEPWIGDHLLREDPSVRHGDRKPGAHGS